jgi:DNA polymerase I-like protein with 3'-5' exonuclease and polymerase domains
MNDNPVAIDFETYYDTKYSLRGIIAEEYCRDERFDAYLLSVYDGENRWVGHPLEFDWESLTGRVVLAHNKYFDLTVWHELARRHGVPVNYAEFHCTANLTSYLCNCRALADAAKKLYGEYVSKGARTDMKGKQWNEISPEQQKEMKEYAIGDVEWCWRFWTDHSHKWSETERRLSNLTIDQGMKGVAVNEPLLQDYRQWIADAIEKTMKVLPWIEDGKKPSSTQALHWQCRKTGIPCPPVKTEDEEGYLQWERDHWREHPWVKAVSSYRSLTKLRSTFDGVDSRLRPDNTMPFALKYFGAHTGRWSGDAKINMQNPRKQSVLINEQGLMETDEDRCKAAFKHQKTEGKLPDWVQHEVNFRHLVVPRPGKKMIVSDLAQIEPRVLAWICKDREFLQLMADGKSPYIAHAVKTMGWEDGWTKSSHPELYQLAKARVLGLGYGCGWEKFIKVAAAMAGLDITKDDPDWELVEKMGPDLEPYVEKIPGHGMTSRRIVKDFRDNSPKIVQLWQQLDGAFKSSVGEDFELTLPSGRVMTYRKVQRTCRMVADKEGKPVGKWVYTADMGHKREGFYGGKLTENLVQAAARDVFAEQMLAIHESGINTLFSCHDELVVEVDPDVSAKDIEQMMSKTPDWLPGCPIAAEAQEVEHYTK